MSIGPVRLWRSVGFRLASLCAFLVALTMLVALGVVYLQTVGLMQARMLRQLRHELQQLSLRAAEGGLEAAAAEMQCLLSDQQDVDGEIYLLVDRDGRMLAGNLDREPATPTSGGTPQRVERRGERISARLLVHRLPDGSRLYVGHDLRDQEAIESLVANASAAASMVAGLLLIGGVFVFRQQLERSVGDVRRTVARIAGGALHERASLSGSDDEFELLRREFNLMLDRIELLMDGVRHVSDAVAHNLRTPLTRVLLRLRSAQQPAGGRQAQAIGAAIEELESLAVMAHKLLQIAEAEAGARRRAFEVLALDELAARMVELYEPAAQAQGVVLQHQPTEGATVWGDAELLAGLVGNLLDNAFKFARPGARVRVGTRGLDAQVLLVVQDDGTGVAAVDLERLGTRFLRLNEAVPGHGLGLASVRAVAALHGGKVRFLDAAPGLRVEVELPAFAQ